MRNYDGLNQLGRLLSESMKEEEKRRVGGNRRNKNTLISVQKEILQEIASQSGRYGHKLTALLTTLKELGEAITMQKQHLNWHSDAEREAINQEIERFNRLQQEAATVRHHLIIHREAMGLWAHHDVFRLYPVPPALPLLEPHGSSREADGSALSS